MLNFVAIDESLSTSGQPTEAELAEIAAQGYHTIINLALAGSDNAVAGESDIVAGLGMNYVHIPVIWTAPRPEQFRLFAAVLQQQADRKVWVHCALNMRVSAFMYLYNRLFRGLQEQEAAALLAQVWQPDPVWSGFIDSVLAGH